MSTRTDITHSDNLEDESSGEAFEVFEFLKSAAVPASLSWSAQLADDPETGPTSPDEAQCSLVVRL